MAKRRRELDYDGAAAETAEINTVFVDTSLGTHLAILVCSSDTASDLKKKVAVEHKQCFPEIGEIQIHSVKVKRRSSYYHLPDSMLVWSAFHGIKRNWFLAIDASNVPICLSIRSSLELGTSSGVKTGMTDIDDDCRGFISDANKKDIISFALPDCAAEKNAVSELIAKPKVDHGGIYSEEHCMGTKSPLKKKRKVRHTKDVFHNSGLGNGDAMSRPNGKDVKPNMPDSIAKVSGMRNDQYGVEGRLVSEESYLLNVAEKGHLRSILDSQNLNGSDRRKDDSGLDHGLGEDVHPLGVVSVMVPGSSARMMDTSGGGGDINLPGGKRKKMKAKKTAAKVHDRTDMDQIRKGERIKPSTDKMEEGFGLSLEHNHDHEVLMPSNSKAPDHVGPDLAPNEASFLQDAEKSNFSIVNSHKILRSDERKEENALENKVDYELGQDVPTVHSGGVCINISDISATLMDVGGSTGDTNIDGKKKKKNKVHKIAKVQDTSDVKQIKIGEMDKPDTETIRPEEKGASLEHDNEVILPADGKDPNHVEPDLALKEASIMRDADTVMEPEISSCIKLRKKKKREKKSVGTNIENSGIKEIPNGIRGSLDLPSPSRDHITKGTGKEVSTRRNEGMDVEMRLLDASNHDVQEKVWDVNRKEEDLVETQAERTLEEVSVRNKMMKEKTKSSPGVCRAVFPTAETENTIMESNKADKDNENTENKSRKATKKRKKQKHTATDVQDNLPVKDQQVNNEPVTSKETSIAFANSEIEGRYVDSSQLLSRKNEEKVDENHELVLKTDGLKKNTEEGDEGINFKHYFVADQLQNQVDFSNKVRKTTKLKRSSTKAKDNDSPSINISAELQNSITDRDEMTHNSFKRSSEAVVKGLKNSCPEFCEMARQEPNDIVSPSSFQNKNPSLDKLSSERSETLHKNRGKERLLPGQSVTNMMLMKTPKKKSLLATGAIFQENSGESSGDDNGTMHSDDSTLSPSDSSSMSGDSAGESELSQNSNSNGSSDAKEKSMSKLEEDLTMDVILRSSKRFKKAKEVASQSETQPIEFVPDSVR
ncbi:uncharacterized protein LOC130995540 isoform X2 [Salvia miltiorrhiza]|uniref:uncharacterized protein LOC130995540 isoform X2 n=1 Tax=Salvia miltiorrhiza TaxID=226208 RepID=UPI0025AC861C|nr:uncharacterized protein LOC130995540 isoform X2 [Salvia miltiorrhiza]